MKYLTKFVLVISFFGLDLATGEEKNLKIVRDNLYESEEGDLFIKFNATVLDSESQSQTKEIYINHLCHPEDEATLLKPLKDTIDKKTWKQIAAFYYADKNHIYLYSPMSSGGFITLFEGVIPSNFMFYYSGSWQPHDKIPHADGNINLLQLYTNDGKHIYFKGDVVEGADPRTFKVMRITVGLVSGNKGVDANSFYDEDKKISREEFVGIAEEYAKSNNVKKVDYAKSMYDLLK